MLRSVKWYGQYIFSTHRLIVFRFDLRQHQPRTRQDPALDITALGESLIDPLVDFHDRRCTSWSFLFDRREVERRLGAGHVCYLARVKGQIVGFSWFCPNVTYCPETACWFGVAPGAVISYNLFVDPDYRGRSISPSIRDRAFHDFSGKQYRECYDYVSTRNRSNLRSIRKYGAAESGHVCYGYCLGLRYLFAPGRKCGLKVIQRAGALAFYKRASQKLTQHRGGGAPR